MKGLLVIVSGPSGTGKTTVVRELIAHTRSTYPIKQVITYTSRDMRKGETAGVDYHQLSAAEFEQKIQEGFFLEWSTAYGAYYGTARSVLDEIAQGTICLLIIDRVGARAIKERIPETIMVWLTVPSLEILRKRLEMRGDSQEQIERRLVLAEKELIEEKKYPFYTYSIENSEKARTIEALENIVVKSIKA